MARIERHIGGAGTGKTRLIEQRLTQAREELGLGHEEVGLCTFTRAGRQELAERLASSWGVDIEALTRHGWVRTAHSIAFKQCGISEGVLLEGQSGADWMSEVLGIRIASRYDSNSESSWSMAADDRGTVAAKALEAWELSRQRLVPLGVVLAEWTEMSRESPGAGAALKVIAAYERAKARDGRIDFTDLVANYGGIRFHADGTFSECDPIGEIPENLRALAIDEAQDSSALVDRVCRRLANSPNMERVFLVGDPYQSVFSFGGSDYKHFLSWEADESIMPRSFRCPKTILDYGERCLREMRSGYRDRKIQPARDGGKIRRFSTASGAVQSLDPTRPALILARCAFSLDDYSDALRSLGIPHAWVDKVGPQAALSGYRCLWDLEHGEVVSGDRWERAIAIVASSVAGTKMIQHGEKKAWKEGRRADIDFIRPTQDDLQLAGCTEAMASMILEGRWPSCLDSKNIERGKEWRESALKHGADITSNPRVRLSTIHSAKGLEADTVILSTQSSRSVEESRDASSEHHDEECRVNYVAVTRSRENLWIVDDSDHYSLELPA